MNGELGLVVRKVFVEVLLFNDRSICADNMVPDESVAYLKDQNEFLLNKVDLRYSITYMPFKVKYRLTQFTDFIGNIAHRFENLFGKLSYSEQTNDQVIDLAKLKSVERSKYY